MAGPIRISILANASQARRELNGVAKETSGLGSKLGKFAKVGGAAVAGGLALAGAGAVKFGVSAVKAASDAQQSIGATQTIFGKFSKNVIKTSNQAATQFGLSANSYRENANLLGSLLANQGVSQDKLAGKTKNLIGVASDLSAVYGGTASDAVEALTSAYKGEFDPLERYGISLKQSQVTTEASAIAQKKFGKSLKDLSTTQQKALQRQATENLLMKQSAKSRGQFSKQTNTLAEQQQILAARFDNLKTKLGRALLPIITKVVKFLSDNLPKAAKFVGKAFEFLKSHIGPVVDAIRKFFSGGDGSGKLASLWKDLKNTAATVFGSIKSIIQSVVGIAKVLWKQFGSTFISIAQNVVTFLQATFTNILQVVRGAFKILSGIFKLIKDVLTGNWKGAWNDIKQIVSGAKDIIVGVVKQLWNIIKLGFKVLWKVVKALAQAAWKGLIALVKAAGKGLWNVIKAGFGLIKKGIGAAWDWVKNRTRDAWNKIKSIAVSAVKALFSFIKNPIGSIKNFITNAWSHLSASTRAKFTEMKNVAIQQVKKMLASVKDIPKTIIGIFAGAGSWLLNAGKDIIQGLINGIESKISWVRDKLSGLTKLIPSWKGPKSKDKKLLTPVGKLIMQSLVKGFEDGKSGVKKALGDITALIKKRAKSNGVEKAALKVLSKRAPALNKNARAQDGVNKKLDAARKKLEDLQATAKDYAKNVKDAITATGDITQLNVPFTAQGIIAGLQKQVDKAKQFATLIGQLTKLGLNKTTLQQLLDAGVEGGLAMANALAQGGQSAVDQVNALTAQLAATGKSLGDSTAQTMYGAGIKAAQGLVDGLTSQLKKLDKAAKRLADALVKAIKKALKIHSPSRVFADIGKQTVAGLDIGLDDGKVRKAGVRLADALTGSFGVPELAANAATGGAGGNNYQITVNAPVGASSADIGREIIKHISAFEQTGGRKRRA